MSNAELNEVLGMAMLAVMFLAFFAGIAGAIYTSWKGL